MVPIMPLCITNPWNTSCKLNLAIHSAEGTHRYEADQNLFNFERSSFV